MEKAKAAYHPSDAVIPNPKLKLLDQVREVIRVKHYSIRTEDAYVQWIKRFIFFHGKRHPREMGAAEIEAFLTDLAVQKQVAASTQNQALNALVFLYKAVLHMELAEFSAVRAKRPERLPVVLSETETAKLLAAIKPGTIGLMVRLLYGTGMRLMECVRLRVKDLLFEENQIVVRDGKGFKDRVTILPSKVKAELSVHLERVKLLHQSDLAAGGGEVYLPYALARPAKERNGRATPKATPLPGPLLGRGGEGTSSVQCQQPTSNFELRTSNFQQPKASRRGGWCARGRRAPREHQA